MMTQTHLLVALAALSKQGETKRNYTIATGALVSDLSIYIMFVWCVFVEGLSWEQIWREEYWTDPWQTLSAVSNSLPLFTGLVVLGVLIKNRLLAVLALAAVFHLALDLPVHASDAHIHFWPLTDWRFHSPVSYWEAGYFPEWVRMFEVGIGLVAIFALFRRFSAIWVRTLLSLGAVSYLIFAVVSLFTI